MNTQPKGGTRPWLKILLAASLALNLAVIGFGAGAAWRYHDGPPKNEGPPMLGRFIFKDLGRQEIRRLLRQRSDETGHARDRRRGEMEKIVTLLRAETLDVDAVNTILEAHVVETNAFLLSVSQVWGQRLEGLSLNQRQQIADRMEASLKHGPRRRRSADRDQ